MINRSTSNLSFKPDPAASTGIPAQAPSPTAASPAPIILPARNQAPAPEVNAEVSHFQEDETSHWGFRKIYVNNYQ